MLKFTAAEIALKINFQSGFRLWEEEDEPNSDDKLSNTVGLHKFHATSDNGGTKTITSKKFFSSSTLDTELGDEELYAVVRLRNTDFNVLMPTKRSATVSVSV